MLRFIGLGLLALAILPALMGYAATFEIEPVVSQEFVVSVEDVETSSEGGPAVEEEADEPIGYLLGTNVVAIAPPEVEPECGAADCDEEDGPAELEPEEEKPAAVAEQEPAQPLPKPAQPEFYPGFASVLPQ